MSARILPIVKNLVVCAPSWSLHVGQEKEARKLALIGWRDITCALRGRLRAAAARH